MVAGKDLEVRAGAQEIREAKVRTSFAKPLLFRDLCEPDILAPQAQMISVGLARVITEDQPAAGFQFALIIDG